MVSFSNAGLCAVSPHESRVCDFQKLRIWLLSVGGFAALEVEDPQIQSFGQGRGAATRE